MIEKFINRDLVRKSFPYLLGMLVGNVFNYFFHINTGRFLGPENFSIFTSLLSLTLILSVFPIATQLLSTRFTALYFAKQDYSSIYSLIFKLSKNLFVVGLIIFLILTILLNPIANFLKVPRLPLFISLLIIPTSYFLLPINRGVFQGLGLFYKLGLNIAWEGIGKFILGLFIIFLGLGVTGIFSGIVITLVAIYFFSIFQLKPYFRKKTHISIKLPKIFAFSFWAFLLTLFITSTSNFDIILVKHFFSSSEAGYYSALSVLGKIILIIPLVITGVMFPQVVEKKERKENYQKILRYSLLMVFGLSFLIVIIYLLFPKTIINLLFGAKYLAIASVLGIYAIAIFFFALSMVFLYYFLAIQKDKSVLILFLIGILQFILIYLFHNSLIQVITILLGLMSSLLLGLVVYYFILKNKYLT